jgi:hypothetical protein
VIRQVGTEGAEVAGPVIDSHDELAGRALVPGSVHERGLLPGLQSVLPNDKEGDDVT